MAPSKQILLNPDFEQVKDSSPLGWHGRGAKLLVSEDIKFNGKNCCLINGNERKKDWQAIAQIVLDAIQTGHQYDFSTQFRMAPDVPKGQKYTVAASLKFNTKNNPKHAYVKIAGAENVTSEAWKPANGTLKMPNLATGDELQEAEVFIRGPPVGIGYMCAPVTMVDPNPGAPVSAASAGSPNMASNILLNPAFEQVKDSSPLEWHGRGAKLLVPKDMKFDGKNCCLINGNERKKDWQAIAQIVLNTIQPGHQYNFSTQFRMAPDVPKGQKYTVGANLKFNTKNNPKHAYIKCAEAQNVTSEAWRPANGTLKMPNLATGDQLQDAEVFIRGPPEGIGYMCAPVVMADTDPSAATLQRSMAAMSVSTQPTSKKQALPKEVFISYQWDIQEWVKTLKDKLEQHGVTCWMDIGQMGGGSALFTEIDTGMRAATVILSCVTGKYSVSENCQREVTLADCLKKPIIPLLFDKSIGWPPPGQMSLIFAKLLYIDMTGQPGSIPEQKFEELLREVKNRRN